MLIKVSEIPDWLQNSARYENLVNENITEFKNKTSLPQSPKIKSPDDLINILDLVEVWEVNELPETVAKYCVANKEQVITKLENNLYNEICNILYKKLIISNYSISYQNYITDDNVIITELKIIFNGNTVYKTKSILREMHKEENKILFDNIIEAMSTNENKNTIYATINCYYDTLKYFFLIYTNNKLIFINLTTDNETIIENFENSEKLMLDLNNYDSHFEIEINEYNKLNILMQLQSYKNDILEKIQLLFHE